MKHSPTPWRTEYKDYEDCRVTFFLDATGAVIFEHDEITFEDRDFIMDAVNQHDALITENEALKKRIAELEAENEELKTAEFFGEEYDEEWCNDSPFQIAEYADLSPCENVKVLGSKVVYEKYIASVPTSLDIDGNIDATEFIEFDNSKEAEKACDEALRKLKEDYEVQS